MFICIGADFRRCQAKTKNGRPLLVIKCHDRIGSRPVDAVPDILGGFRIEEADLEFAGQPQRLLSEDFDSICFDERCVALTGPNSNLPKKPARVRLEH